MADLKLGSPKPVLNTSTAAPDPALRTRPLGLPEGLKAQVDAKALTAQTVVKGDSLWSLWESKGKSVTWPEFRQLNEHLQGDRLLPGDVVALPNAENGGWKPTVAATKPTQAAAPPAPPAPPAAPAAAAASAPTPAEVGAKLAGNYEATLNGLRNEARGVAALPDDKRGPALQAVLTRATAASNELQASAQTQLGAKAGDFVKTQPNLGQVRTELTNLAKPAGVATKLKELGEAVAADASQNIARLGAEQDAVGKDSAVLSGLAAAGGFMGKAVHSVEWLAGQAMKVAGTVAERPAVVGEQLDKLAHLNGDDVKNLASSAGDAIAGMGHSIAEAYDKRGLTSVLVEGGLNVATLGLGASKAGLLSKGAKVADNVAMVDGKVAEVLEALPKRPLAQARPPQAQLAGPPVRPQLPAPPAQASLAGPATAPMLPAPAAPARLAAPVPAPQLPAPAAQARLAAPAPAPVAPAPARAAAPSPSAVSAEHSYVTGDGLTGEAAKRFNRPVTEAEGAIFKGAPQTIDSRDVHRLLRRVEQADPGAYATTLKHLQTLPPEARKAALKELYDAAGTSGTVQSDLGAIENLRHNYVSGKGLTGEAAKQFKRPVTEAEGAIFKGAPNTIDPRDVHRLLRRVEQADPQAYATTLKHLQTLPPEARNGALKELYDAAGSSGTAQSDLAAIENLRNNYVTGDGFVGEAAKRFNRPVTEAEGAIFKAAPNTIDTRDVHRLLRRVEQADPQAYEATVKHLQSLPPEARNAALKELYDAAGRSGTAQSDLGAIDNLGHNYVAGKGLTGEAAKQFKRPVTEAEGAIFKGAPQTIDTRDVHRLLRRVEQADPQAYEATLTQLQTVPPEARNRALKALYDAAGTSATVQSDLEAIRALRLT